MYIYVARPKLFQMHSIDCYMTSFCHYI